MTLEDYLESEGMSINKFSVMAGVSVTTIYRIISGGSASNTVADIIHERTDGVVSVPKARYKGRQKI